MSELHITLSYRPLFTGGRSSVRPLAYGFGIQ
jgi:hypothetical protein